MKSAVDVREMLRAMQAGELTVSRGIELLEMWIAGNYSDDLLPPVRQDLIEEDSMPAEIIDRLRKQRDELLAALERLADLANGFSVSGVYFHEERQNAEAIKQAFDAIDNAKSRATAAAPTAEALREAEVHYLAGMLASSIANLGYPVGCGIPPSEEHVRKAAEQLFERFVGLSRLLAQAMNQEGGA